MKKISTRTFLFFLFFLFLNSTPLCAQGYKPENALLIEIADTAAARYERTSVDSLREESLNIYLKIIRSEKKLEHPDTPAIIHCEFMVGYVDVLWGEYQWGRKAFERMLKYAKRPKDDEIINRAIPYLGYCYRKSRLKNYIFDIPEFSNTERREFYFPITYVFKYTEDTLKVKINFGQYDGIGLGALGIVRGVKTDLIYGHNSKLLGNCQVSDIAESQAILKVFDFKGKDSVHMVFTGDMVRLPIQFPKRYHDNITKSLMYGSTFYNNDGHDFYDYRQWYMHGSDSLFEDIVQAMVSDLHNGYEKFKNSDLKVLKNVGESGRFKDKTLLEVLRITTVKDVKDFLNYSSFYAASYYGRLSLIVKYADWVLVNTPISYGEFSDALENANTNSEFEEIVKIYKEDALEHDFFTYLGNDEESMVENGQIERAFKLNSKHALVAEKMNSSIDVGWAYFFKARMHNTLKNDDSVVKSYNKAIEFFVKAKDVKGEGYCIGNLAAKYYDMEDYKKSLNAYLRSYELKFKVVSSDSSLYYKSVAIALHGVADCYNIFSEYDSALYRYQEAVRFYNLSNSVDARARSLSAYKKIASILKKQSKYPEAYESYVSLKEKYFQLGDQKNVAETYDELADVLFSLNDYIQSVEWYNKAYLMKLSWDDKAGAGFSKSAVGQALYNLGEYDLAIAAHDTAVSLRGEANDQSGVAYSLGQIGSLYKENGEYVKAENYFDKSYEIYNSLGYRSNKAGVNVKRGDLATKIANYVKALQYYEEALSLYKELNDKIEIGNCYYNIASVYNKMNKYKKALNFVDTALIYQYGTGDQSGQLFSLLFKGLMIETDSKDSKRAMSIYKEALSIAKLTASPYNIASCQNSIGILYNTQGEFSKARPYYDSSYQIYVDIKDRLQQSYSLVNLGYYFSGIGSFKEAEKRFKQALELAESIKNNSAIANAYGALGAMGRVTGEYEQSIDYLNKSVEINKSSENPWGVASNYIDLGNTYNEQSLYSEAVKYYLKSDSIYKKINSPYFRSTPLNNAGTVFYHQGNYDSSLTYFEPCLDLLKKYDPEGDFINLVTINIGEVYAEQKLYDKAEKWLTLGLNNSLKREENRNKALSYRVNAKFNINRGNYKLAEEQAFKAYKLEGDSGEIDQRTDLYNQIGRVRYELKDYKTANIWFDKTIKTSEAIGFLKFLYPAYYYSALSYKSLNQNDSALRRLKRAIEVVEKISRQVTGGAEAQKKFTSGDLQQKMYETMVEWLLGQGKIEEAISYLEKGNNEALNAKFKQLKGSDRGADNETQKALAEAEQKQKTIEKLNAELIKEKSKPIDQQKTELIKKLEEKQEISQREYNRFFTKLVKENKKVQLYLSNSVNPEDFKAERKNVSEDMAVLLYMMTDQKLYIFCATHDSVFAKVIGIEGAELSKKIMTMYDLVRNPGFLPTTRRGSKLVNMPKIENPEQVLNETSKDLYNILIGSVKLEIGNKTKLAIIPNGDLFYLPFHALISSEQDNKINYLMDDFTVFYSNRLKFLGSSHKIDLEDFRPMAIGNADKSLPNAEIEVNDIKALFPKSMILVGDKATKSELISQSGKYNVLHFATHGILDYQNFDSSYLVMAPDKTNGDKGHFTLNDIGDLDMIDEYTLVTLSACETAVKKDLVEGYPQTTASAFLKAGVETVVASLWQVDDKATSLLMKKFYENLSTLNKVEALHKAQIDLSKMQGFSHPYYWAPFAYYGK